MTEWDLKVGIHRWRLDRDASSILFFPSLVSIIPDDPGVVASMNVRVKGQKATYSGQYGDGTKALREMPLTLRAATILAHNHRRVDGPPEAPVERFMVFGIVLGINALLTIGLLYVTRW